MEWDELSKKDKEMFKYVGKDQVMRNRFFSRLEFTKLKKCPMCKQKFDEALYLIKDSKLTISGKWAFHLQDTHGIHKDVVRSFLEEAE